MEYCRFAVPLKAVFYVIRVEKSTEVVAVIKGRRCSCAWGMAAAGLKRLQSAETGVCDGRPTMSQLCRFHILQMQLIQRVIQD